MTNLNTPKDGETFVNNRGWTVTVEEADAEWVSYQVDGPDFRTTGICTPQEFADWKAEEAYWNSDFSAEMRYD
jgi:hypothetical protein